MLSNKMAYCLLFRWAFVFDYALPLFLSGFCTYLLSVEWILKGPPFELRNRKGGEKEGERRRRWWRRRRRRRRRKKGGGGGEGGGGGGGGGEGGEEEEGGGGIGGGEGGGGEEDDEGGGGGGGGGGIGEGLRARGRREGEEDKDLLKGPLEMILD